MTAAGPFVVFAVLAVVLLSACGQKGPLTLRKVQAQTSSPPASSPAASAPAPAR